MHVINFKSKRHSLSKMSSSPSGQTIIPTYTTSALGQIYSPAALADQTSRWRNLRRKFQDLYGQEPDHVARSPGRVNLIGEVS